MQTVEIEREGRHRVSGDGLSTMEIVALARANSRPTQQLAALLPDPDSGAGWALQLFTSVFIGSVATGITMLAMVQAITFWTQVAP